MPRSLPATLLLVTFIISTAVVANEPTRSDKLDQLFIALKQAPNEASAQKIEHQIWTQWMATNNPEINNLMQQAMQARRWSDFDKALELLDQVILINPTYAEAWNQRATIHFHRGNYETALEYVAKTLALEPRHFGALAGRGIIRLRQGRSALAIQNIKAAMVFHPYLRERNLVPPQFSDNPANPR